MTLTPGTRLGPYEVTALIGVGGMGEVYRAMDTNLGRHVAIKVLPPAFAHNPDRLARFEREAKTLASLNHPNIAQIHGLEKSGGISTLVMELVEGPTLADRIAQGAIPIDEALPIAKQIAEAVEAAHEQGIIHRDLKPANIKVRADGTVKVLDFGLAKALEPTGAMSPSVSQSPTITSPAMMTGVGMILGTAAYMSPEQARGRPVDKRTDIWAFGAVLFEMLTGKRAFPGEDVTDTLANVLKREPDWTALPADASAAVRALLRRCLEKDRRERAGDISIALFVLKEQGSLAASVGVASVSRPRSPLWRRVLTPVVAAFVASTAVGTAVWFATRHTPLSVVRTTIVTSGSAALALQGQDRNIAITPDGSRVVYRGNNQLLVRALDQLEPTVLRGLGAPQGVFISPDGQWIGFFDGTNLLKKVAITGGLPIMTAAVDGGGPRGATWGPDGTVVYATNASRTGLQSVSAAGGEPIVLTRPDRERGEGDHYWPEFLPGGEAVLFTITPNSGIIGNALIAVWDRRSGTSKVLIRGGSHAHYVSTGHLVYVVSGTLRAVPFDLGRLELVGTSTPVLEGVVTTGQGAADVVVAASGSLVYVPGTGSGTQRNVVSVDRQGRASPLVGVPPDSYRDVRVSPNGARLALATQDEVWTYDLLRATLSRLTTDRARDASPLWTTDGQRIIYTSSRMGDRALFGRMADGSGSDERLLTRADGLLDLLADSWSPEGGQLVFSEVSGGNQCAIGQVVLERPSDVIVLVKNEFCNSHAAVSPNGRWMAYRSRRSGRDEVYIERYPELGSRQQISAGGGSIPVWSRNGEELFFASLDGRQMFAVPVRSGTTLVAGRPEALFEFPMLPVAGGARPYDVAPDQRFFIIRSDQADPLSGSSASNLIVVQNWTEELKRLVPTN